MGDNRLVKVAIVTGMVGCLLAVPASAQSLGDRFKSLFGGGKSDEPATAAPGAPVPEDTGDLTCPPVTVRAGASTYAVAAPGKQPVGNDLRFQATITKMARECSVNAGTIGYWVGEPHAHRGYMTTALRVLLPTLFGELNLHRIEAACIPTNAPSIRVLEKCGFSREGLARRYLCINGVWQDHLLFGLLHEDFRG